MSRQLMGHPSAPFNLGRDETLDASPNYVLCVGNENFLQEPFLMSEIS